MKRYVDALAPYASGQSVDRIVGELNRFGRRPEGHCCQHRAENFLLRDDRSGMHIAQQGGSKIEAARGHFELRLPAGCAFGDTLIHQPAYALQLHRGHNRANVDRLIQG